MTERVDCPSQFWKFGYSPVDAWVLDLARCEFIERKENILALGKSGTRKTHIALALGPAACQKSFRVRFTTAKSQAYAARGQG
jgi:DNA replication protein DnaC